MDQAIKIVEFIINNNIFVVFLFFVIVLFRNAKDLIQSLDTWKTIKTSNLELALKSPYLKGYSRRLIEQKLEQRHFYLSTGFDAERTVREKILQVYEFCSGELRFIHFVRAKDHYKFENSKLSVSWGAYKTFSLWYHLFVSLLFSVISLLIFYVIVSSFFTDAIIDRSSTIDLLPSIIVIAITAIIFLRGWITLYSTNLVRKKIERFNKEKSKINNERITSESNF